MILIKNSLVRVRCIECSKEKFISLDLHSIDRKQRSISYEYYYLYTGEVKCECGEDLKVLIKMDEYPKGTYNYSESMGESCLLMDDITEDSFNKIF